MGFFGASSTTGLIGGVKANLNPIPVGLEASYLDAVTDWNAMRQIVLDARDLVRGVFDTSINGHFYGLGDNTVTPAVSLGAGKSVFFGTAAALKWKRSDATEVKVLDDKAVNVLELDANGAAPVAPSGKWRLRHTGTELQVSYNTAAYAAIGGGGSGDITAVNVTAPITGGAASGDATIGISLGFGLTTSGGAAVVDQGMAPTWTQRHIFNSPGIRLAGSGDMDGGSNEALANTIVLGIYSGGSASTFRLKSRNGTAGATDIGGSHLALAGGRATGNALGGDVIFETSSGGESSGTTTRNLVARWRVKGNTGHLLPESSGYDIATQATPVSFLWASDLRTTQIAPLSAASQLNLRGELAAGSAGADIIHDTLNTRTAGVLFSQRNNTVEKFAVAFDGSITTAGRVHEGKGADIASANDITCTRGFHVITGTTTVKRIAKAGWSDGDILRLRMSGTCTIGDAAATGDATWAKIVMYSNAQTCQAVTLIYDGGVFYQLTYHVPTLP